MGVGIQDTRGLRGKGAGGSQANGGGGYVRYQGSQGQGGGRVCERPGVSGEWWGWVYKIPGVSGARGRVDLRPMVGVGIQDTRGLRGKGAGGSQANGGGGYTRYQGSQGQGGGRVCERPGVSGQWWGWVYKIPGVSGARGRAGV